MDGERLRKRVRKKGIDGKRGSLRGREREKEEGRGRG